MNISSLILRARPESLPQVRIQLAALPGVEVHADHDDGRMVVTVEDTEASSAADTMLAVHTASGVISTTLVYQYTDEFLSDIPEQQGAST
jgi:nitrate reductase NapD